MDKIEIRQWVVLGFASVMLTASAAWAHDDHWGVRFQATLQTTSAVGPSPAGRCDDPNNLLLTAEGAGDTNLIGVVLDTQSHCIVNNVEFKSGEFKLTNPQNKTVEGRYFGTVNLTIKPGVFTINGNVCILKVAGRPVSDCSQPPKNYEPARGITDVTTGEATIFLDQFIRFKHAH